MILRDLSMPAKWGFHVVLLGTLLTASLSMGKLCGLIWRHRPAALSIPRAAGPLNWLGWWNVPKNCSWIILNLGDPTGEVNSCLRICISAHLSMNVAVFIDIEKSFSCGSFYSWASCPGTGCFDYGIFLRCGLHKSLVLSTAWFDNNLLE